MLWEGGEWSVVGCHFRLWRVECHLRLWRVECHLRLCPALWRVEGHRLLRLPRHLLQRVERRHHLPRLPRLRPMVERLGERLGERLRVIRRMR